MRSLVFTKYISRARALGEVWSRHISVCIFGSSPRPVPIQSCEKRRAAKLTSASETSLCQSFWLVRQMRASLLIGGEWCISNIILASLTTKPWNVHRDLFQGISSEVKDSHQTWQSTLFKTPQIKFRFDSIILLLRYTCWNKCLGTLTFIVIAKWEMHCHWIKAKRWSPKQVYNLWPLWW